MQEVELAPAEALVSRVVGQAPAQEFLRPVSALEARALRVQALAVQALAAQALAAQALAARASPRVSAADARARVPQAPASASFSALVARRQVSSRALWCAKCLGPTGYSREACRHPPFFFLLWSSDLPPTTPVSS